MISLPLESMRFLMPTSSCLSFRLGETQPNAFPKFSPTLSLSKKTMLMLTMEWMQPAGISTTFSPDIIVRKQKRVEKEGEGKGRREWKRKERGERGTERNMKEKKGAD